MTRELKRVVVLISGRGSNMRSIVEACQSGSVDANVVAVISNNPEAQGLAFAAQQNINTAVLSHQQFASRTEFDSNLTTLINQYKPDWILLAGFMRVLGTELVNHFIGRLINIHPSLLPRHPGLNTHASVLAAGETTHGATVHFVTAELDAGPIIAQTQVPVLPDDTEQSLAERVLQAEHKLYVHALQLCVNGEARLANGIALP